MAYSMMSVQIKKDFRTLDYIDSRDFLMDLNDSNLEVALAVVEDIRSSWSGSSPSSPGQPPAVVTGALDQSIKVKEARNEAGRFTNSANAVSHAIVVESEYGAALEYGDPSKNLRPRPFLRPAIFRMRQKVGDHYKTVFRFRQR